MEQKIYIVECLHWGAVGCHAVFSTYEKMRDYMTSIADREGLEMTENLANCSIKIRGRNSKGVFLDIEGTEWVVDQKVAR